MTNPPADPVRRQAARAATLVAVPVAIAVVAISLWVYGGSAGTAAPTTSDSAQVQATAPVTMTAPPLAEDVAAVCRLVIARLPDAVAGLSRRPVTAGAEQNAAYGDPAITLTCGVTGPSVAPTALVYPLAGVCWAAVPGAGGTVWTTVDRTVPIVVTVPGQPDGSGQSVVPLAAVVNTQVPRLSAPPAGCG